MPEADLEVWKATIRGDAATVQKWFESGGRDPDATDHMGRPLLYCAAQNVAHSGCGVLRVLLAHGADATKTEPMYGNTALHATTFYVGLGRRACCDAAALLLDHGADVDARAHGDRTPLMYAAYFNQVAIVPLLLGRGADLDARGQIMDARSDDACDVEAHALAGGIDGAKESGTHARRPDFIVRAFTETCFYFTRVRAAGGWPAFARAPRASLLALRSLAARGRATTDDALLRRLFVDGVLPREVLWAVLACWRSARDRDPRF